jgi:hypothetical protein
MKKEERVESIKCLPNCKETDMLRPSKYVKFTSLEIITYYMWKDKSDQFLEVNLSIAVTIKEHIVSDLAIPLQRIRTSEMNSL